MSEFNIEVEGGKAVRLPTAGKYCDRDIVVTATGGGSDEYWDTFWDACQDNGNRTNYQYAFAYKGWTENNFKPKYNMSPTNADYMFRYSNIEGSLVELLENAGVTLDFGNSQAMTYVFADCPITEIGIIDTRSASDLYRMFWQTTKVEKIEKIILKDDGSQQLNAFVNCLALKEIRFEGKIGVSESLAQSRYLSVESVQSIIDHLKDLTGATAQTLTIHAEVGAKLTQAQKDAVSAKNWTLVY